MAYTINEKLDWIMIFILEFGRKHGLTMKQAFNYLYRYQGMAFLEKHYDYVHTQSFKSMVDDLTDYCHRKGGGLLWSYIMKKASILLTHPNPWAICYSINPTHPNRHYGWFGIFIIQPEMVFYPNRPLDRHKRNSRMLWFLFNSCQRFFRHLASIRVST